MAHLEDPILKSFYDRIEKKLDRGEIEIPLSIQFAITRNSPRLLLHLIKRGLDLEEVYANGQTILHIAANHQDLEPCFIDIILQYSIDVNKRDSTNKPPISYAIERRRKDVLDLFRSKAVMIPNDMVVEYCRYAVDNDDLELLQIIHDLGGDINMAVNEEGDTPIYRAVCLEKIEVVRYLLKLKADYHKRGIKATSALDAAVSHGFETIFRLMCSYGGTR